MHAERTRIGRLPVKWWLGALAAAAVVFGGRRFALDCYERIVALDPADERARNTVGNLRMELGDTTGAVRAFEQLLASSPRNATAWFNLGFIHDKQGADADAERCFRAAVEIDPKLDRAWYGLGLVLIRQGRLEEAVSALKRNTALQPFSPYGWYQLAMTLHHLGQGAEAWRIHDELKRFEPRYAATLKRDLEQTQPRGARGTPPVSNDAASKEAIATTA
jgi:tetratricopeptide (TPR) repeat protein